MKKIIILVIACTAILACGPSKPLTPEEQLAVDAKKAQFRELFESKSFVVEANTVYGKKGQSFQLSPNINFVMLNNGEGTLQLSFNNIMGWNGVGGITLDGKVRNYEILESKNNAMPRVKFDMNGTFGWATVNISTNSTGNARATVDGNFGERITFAGQLNTLDKSGVYKGTPLF